MTVTYSISSDLTLTVKVPDQATVIQDRNPQKSAPDNHWESEAEVEDYLKNCMAPQHGWTVLNREV